MSAMTPIYRSVFKALHVILLYLFFDVLTIRVLIGKLPQPSFLSSPSIPTSTSIPLLHLCLYLCRYHDFHHPATYSSLSLGLLSSTFTSLINLLLHSKSNYILHWLVNRPLPISPMIAPFTFATFTLFDISVLNKIFHFYLKN